MKLSVIIPVYQAEKTIARCLDSLVKQADNDVEVILVNDGSNDRSEEICKKYASLYPIIRYYSKENGGVSSARNLGLDKATGEYVLFVDSDDYVADTYFKEIRKGVCNEPDILLFGRSVVGFPEKDRAERAFYSVNAKDTSKIISKILEKNRLNSLCVKAFKKDIIDRRHIRFLLDLANAEDISFIIAFLCEIQSASSITSILYYVDESNNNSLSRKVRKNLDEQLLTATKSMLETVDQSIIDKIAKKNYLRALSWLYYRSVYTYAKEIQKIGLKSRERRMLIRRACFRFTRNHVRSHSFKCFLMALPIRLHLSAVLDYIAKLK